MNVNNIVVALLMLDIGMRLQEYIEHLRYRRISRNVMREIRETERWKQSIDALYQDVMTAPTPDEHKVSITDWLLTLWQEQPELRLSQLLLNCFEKQDWYNLDDDDLMIALQTFYTPTEDEQKKEVA